MLPGGVILVEKFGGRFRKEIPDLTHFAGERWLRAAREVDCDQHPCHEKGYNSHIGSPECVNMIGVILLFISKSRCRAPYCTTSTGIDKRCLTFETVAPRIRSISPRWRWPPDRKSTRLNSSHR